MPLDFSQLTGQVRNLGSALRETDTQRRDRVAEACSMLVRESEEWEHWCAAVREDHARAPWLLACPSEPIAAVHDLPPCPPSYTLAASDGSQIDVDRHGPAECFLVNVGLVLLRYGDHPTARLWSEPRLYFQPEELALTDSKGRRYAVEGPLVHATRDVAEAALLARIAAEMPPELPRLALQDGTLIRWPFYGFDPDIRAHFLDGYLEALDVMQEAGVPVASYISRPRAPEVTGLVRLMHDPDIEKLSEPDPAEGVIDQLIFSELLRPGQRSAIFVSMSKINVELYGAHLVSFFYLHAGREICRVEMPRWVASDPAAVDLVHAIAFDQAQRGGGYPVALARAHEQAIVREADRRTFRQLVESTLTRSRLATAGSLKQVSKDHTRV